MRSGSNLETVLESGRFAVTAEIGPPRSCDAEHVRKLARLMKGTADAFNLTDNQSASVRLSSLAAAVACIQEGVEPVMQMTCRDRNRIAMQSDILGACSLGVKNVLCISGDHQLGGSQPQAKNVYDLDSIQQLMVFKGMRDDGRIWGGEEIAPKPQLFLGAAANPFADPFEFRVVRLGKKIAAGADFIQTQSIFDMPRFEKFMSMAREKGLHEKVHIMAGLLPLKSAKMASIMKDKVAGMIVPQEIIDRMKAATDQKAEGVKICLEQIDHLRSIEGVHGIHVMAVNWEEKVPEILRDSGLAPR
jgi:methylenetetrahydrofolate reductase (NADPH)